MATLTRAGKESVGRGGGHFDGFISYSHSADDLLAPRLQSALQSFAKPWWRRRALHLFRDQSSLSANPHLWSSIAAALDASEWFILLTSPEAAASPWVNREVAYWLEHKSVDRILPVLTGGTLLWDEATGLLDPSSSVPPALLGAFAGEPRWVDLSWPEEETQLDLRNGRYREAVADIASALRGIPKDDLESEEVREHRRTRRTVWAAGIALAMLAVAATGGALLAVDQRNEADQQRATAEAETARAVAAESTAKAETARAVSAEELARSRELAASAIKVLDEDPELSILLGLEAIATAPSGAGRPVAAMNTLREGVHASRLRSRWAVSSPENYVWLDLSPDDTRLAVVSESEGTIKLLDAQTGRQLWVFEDPMMEDSFFVPSFSSDGLRIAVGVFEAENPRNANSLPDLPRPSVANPSDDGWSPRLMLFDAATGSITQTIRFPPCQAAAPVPSFSPDGRWLAVGGLPGDDCETVDGWEVLIYDASTMEPVYRVPTGGDLHLSWTGGGEALVVGTDYAFGVFDPITDLIDMETGQVTLEPPYFAGAINPDGSRIVLDQANDLSLFDLEVGAVVDELSGIKQLVVSKTFTPDGLRLVVGTRGEEVLVFDVFTGELLQQLGAAGSPTSLACNRSCDLLYQASGGEVLTWDLSEAAGGELGASDTGYWVNGDSITTAGPIGAFVGYPLENDGLIPDVVPIDLATGLLLSSRHFSGSDHPAALPDGRIVMLDVSDTAPEWGPVVAWDPRTDESDYVTGCRTTAEAVYASQQGRASTPDCADSDGSYFFLHRALLSPDGENLLLLSQAGELRILDAADFQEEMRQTLPEGPDSLLAYGGDWIVISEGESARVQAVEDGRVLASLVNGTASAWAALSKGGDRLAVAEYSGDAVVYDTGTWEAISWFDNGAQQRGVAFSPDGTKLLTAGNDGYVRVWDTNAGTELSRIPVTSPSDGYWLDEEHVVVGTSTGLWTTLTLDQAELEGLAVARLTRGFTEAECDLYLIDPCRDLASIRDRGGAAASG